MAKNFITFEHPRTGITREAPIGFSWQLLQFGALLPLFQREWRLCVLVIVAGVATFSVSNILLAFFYNKLRVMSLVKQGFLARGTEHGSIAETEARLQLKLPRHLPSDEPPNPAPRDQLINTKTSNCPAQKPACPIDSRAGTTITVRDHGTVQNRLLYPSPRHD